MTVDNWRFLVAGNEAHVYPVGDLTDHEPIDCACGPRSEAVKHDDGSVGWVTVHASLDGRERSE